MRVRLSDDRREDWKMAVGMTVAVWVTLDGACVAASLREARDRFESAEGELVLDCSAVSRLDDAGLRAMEELAAAAEEKGVKLALRAVNIDVYRVLKLTKLTPRLLFIN